MVHMRERASDEPRTQDRGNASSGAGRNERHAELKAAVGRFERAVEDLASTAREEFGVRATAFIDDTTARLEREVGSRRESRRSRRNRRRRDREGGKAGLYYGANRSAGLYRDPYRRKIAGVCAGLAPYLGVQTWVVRVAAITGALFFPLIVIPAYLVAIFLMPTRRPEDLNAGESMTQPRDRESGPTETPKEPRSARRDFKDTQSLISQAELRLRRMEAHVTSDKYELQKELSRLENGGISGGATT